MDTLIRRLFSKQENVHFMTAHFLKLLGVKVNLPSLEDAFEEHPDFPSLLAIKDVLSRFRVDSVAIKLADDRLSEIQLPFLSRTKADEFGAQNFTIVKPLETGGFEFLHPKSGKWVAFEKEEFDGLLTPIALFAEAAEGSGEKDYQAKRKAEARRVASQWLKMLLLPISGLVLLSWLAYMTPGNGAGFLAFFLLYLIGAGVGSLLLLFEIDQHNPLVKQVCSGGSKSTNCNAVLQSDGAKVLGMSWSLIGFTYFLSGLIVFTLADFAGTAYLALMSALSLAAVPFIAYSLYYQWRVVKQWCRLCLAVQVILAVQAAIVLFEGWYMQIAQLPAFPVRETLSLLLIFTLIMVLGESLIKSGKRAREGKKNKQSFIKLKSNPDIFESLTKNQRALSSPSDGLGILLGNPDAKHTLVKVCNPYCGPCAKAHPAISKLLSQNKDLKVQVIFTATNEDNDQKGPPVRHLLAIAQQGDLVKTEQALDDWYLAEQKDYEQFAFKYPLNGELALQREQIDKMSAWCDDVKIRHTPTYFLNGFELPQIYGIEDLDYFLKS